jgi:dynein light chain LC8-type
MREAAVEVITNAVGQNSLSKDIAQAVKKDFDSKFPQTTWHCIVGRHFGVSISFATRHMIFASVGLQNVLLFKSDE